MAKLEISTCLAIFTKPAAPIGTVGSLTRIERNRRRDEDTEQVEHSNC